LQPRQSTEGGPVLAFCNANNPSFILRNENDSVGLTKRRSPIPATARQRLCLEFITG
jgi:hypothetical protein